MTKTRDLADLGGGFIQAGTGAQQRTVESKLQDVVSVKDFGAVGDPVAIQAALTYAVANGKIVGFDADATIRIPDDVPTLQDAVDHATVLGPYEIDLVIQSGHQPNSGVDVSNGDYGFFKISSIDAVVTLGATFPATAIIRGTYAKMPTLNCLIDANGKGLDGYFAQSSSTGNVSVGCGIDNAQQHGCHARSGSSVQCGGALFRNASQATPAYSGILSWGSIVYASAADVSNSNYYGAQAAASGLLYFRDGIANGCARHNIRATNAAVVNARDASAQNGGVSGVRSFDTGIVNANGVNVTGSAVGLWCQNCSQMYANNAVANSTTGSVIYCDSGSKVVAPGITATGTAAAIVVRSENGSNVLLDGAILSNASTKALNASGSSSVTMTGGSLTGGDGVSLISVSDASKVYLSGVNTSCSGTEAYLATAASASELCIFNGTHTFPNDSVNMTEGSFLRLHGSGITAASVPGVLNDTLYGRGIMWGGA